MESKRLIKLSIIISGVHYVSGNLVIVSGDASLLASLISHGCRPNITLLMKILEDNSILRTENTVCKRRGSVDVTWKWMRVIHHSTDTFHSGLPPASPPHNRGDPTRR